MEEKNSDFVQLYRKNMPAVRDAIREQPVAAEIFMFLSEHMNYNNAVVASDTILQEMTGKSRTTIYRAKKFLVDKGYLTIMKSGNSNVYALNPNLVWSSWRTNKKYCEFDGTILISRSENQEIDEKVKAMTEKHLKII